MKRSITLALLALLVSIVGCAPAATQSPTAVPPAPTARPSSTAVPPAPTEPPATAVPTPIPTVASSWEIILDAEVDQPFLAAAFLDETYGLTVGRRNDAVYYTTDGGQTWVNSTVEDRSCRFGIDIVDAQTAWSCGGRLPATLSLDGGQTWIARERMSPNYCTTQGFRQCRFLSFLDDTTGWGASPINMATTNDGGATWTEITPPAGIAGDVIVMAIALRTPTDGYLMDSAGALYVTQDGGQSWTSQDLGLNIGSRTMLGAAVRFSDADRGVVITALVGGGQNEFLALYTSDGGQTWEREPLPTGPGEVYLTHDGKVLTVISPRGDQITVLRYQGD